MVVLTGHQKQKNDLKGSQIIFPAFERKTNFFLLEMEETLEDKSEIK